MNFPYVLRQYLRILTHPIIHFLHFLRCIQFFNISHKKISAETQWGGFNPQTPFAYASDRIHAIESDFICFDIIQS